MCTCRHVTNVGLLTGFVVELPAILAPLYDHRVTREVLVSAGPNTTHGAAMPAGQAYIIPTSEYAAVQHIYLLAAAGIIFDRMAGCLTQA